MGNINLQCGHCGKTMAVTESSLGKQVRCPHCQQVVQAPSASDVMLPGPVTPSADAGWSSETTLPPPSLPRLSPEEEQRLYAGTGPDEPTEVSTEPIEEHEIPGETTSRPPWLGNVPPQDPDDTIQNDDPLGLESKVADEPAQEAFVPPPAPVKVRRDLSKWLIILVVPLVSYACLSTVAVIYLKLQTLNRAPDPFEKMLDEGDAAMPDPDRALPAELRRPIGGAITVGSLEVKATRIERRSVSISADKPDKDNAKDALVLHLHIKNLSDDSIKPLDFYFDRRWNTEEHAQRRPYTLLQLSKRVFYGGPLSSPNDPKHQNPKTRSSYAFLLKNDSDGPNMPEKQDHDRVLKAHESMDTWICTDCNNPQVIDAFQKQTLKSGKYLWRVQVRRGLVTVHDIEVWASAVVGFEFTPSDVKDVR